MPLSQFVLKVHSRCDLACDHCYVYEHADQSWRRQPLRMAPETVRAAARRIAQHAEAHALPQVRIVLHGGEPLLLGLERIREIITELRAAIAPVTRLHLGMQSNGLRLNEAFGDLFAAQGVRLGISFDGDRAANDRHRRYANGASSHAGVRQALALLRQPKYRKVYGGILCTVDIANDPIAVYEALLAEEPPAIDFLLPHATWENPPPRPAGTPAPYAEWLLRIHQRWLDDGRPVRIRLFESIHDTRTGGPSGTEAVGLDPADLVVVETDGSWEQVDSLKTAYDGAPATGLDVFRHSVDAAAAHPGIAERQLGLAGLCDTCRDCPVVGQCGGGLYPHRYRPGTGFANPSVYCDDLKELIVSVNASAPRPADAPAPPDAATTRLLDDLGTGYGDEASIAALADTQLGITRALLAEVGADAGGIAKHAWPLIVTLDATAPAAVDRVLRHPFVRTWAIGCLRGTGTADHLAALAAAAAIRAGGGPHEVEVAVHDATLVLPTIGAFPVPFPVAATLLLRHDRGRVTLRDGHREVTLAVTPDDTLVEDTDPFRDCFDRPAAPPLSPAGRQAWTRALDGAWRLIAREVPGQLPGLRSALAAVVPLVSDPAGIVHSATARDAFGAVGTVLCEPADLALQLVHEFQHSKLGALLDILDLLDPQVPGRFTVGWRPDPRPLEGVLQGAYAHLAVADVWRVRAAGSEPATAAFLRNRDWTVAAIDTLLSTGALTPAGDRLVHRMAATIAGW